MPRVSALITVFNEETWIAAAVESLLRQDMEDIEILVIDDGSYDRTSEILSGFSDPRLRVLSVERIGRAASLQMGLNEARGAFIAILDADDESYPQRLSRQLAFMEAHPEVAWLGCGEERRDSQRSEQAVRHYPETDAATRIMAARCIPYSHSGVMIRRSVVDDGLNYDPSVPYLIDFEFFLRVAERHKVANLPDVLVMRRLRNESFFQSRFKRKAQNRALAQLCASAVHRFGLPRWHLAFPLARLGYDLVPDRFKRGLRRVAGLKENFGPVT